MKRIVIFCLLGFTSSAVMADDVLEQDAQSSQEQEVVTERSSFDGFYLGAGIGGSFSQNKYDGVMKKQNVNRFIGDIHVGYGKVLRERFYLGLEVLLEGTSTKTSDAELNDDLKKNLGEILKKIDKMFDGAITDPKLSAKVKNKGITPEVTVKVGYVAANCMFYAKAGAAKPRTEIDVFGSAKVGATEHRGHFVEKITKVKPVIAIGAARAFGNRWNANVEVGYQFKQKVQILGRDFETNGGPKVRLGVSHTF